MIYGYKQQTVSENGLLQMKEISIQASADDLDQIADFLKIMADKIRSGEVRPGGHMHFDQVIHGWMGDLHCDIIVLF